MPWVRKAGAPAYASSAEVKETLLTGDPVAWIVPWLSIAPGQVYDMDAFCAIGPPDCGGLELSDAAAFLPGAGAIGRALSIVELQARIECWMRQRLFGIYCENVVASTGPGWTTPVCMTIDQQWSQSETTLGIAPPTATKVRFSYSQVTGGGLLQMMVDSGGSGGAAGVAPYNYFPWPTGGSAPAQHERDLLTGQNRVVGAWEAPGGSALCCVSWYADTGSVTPYVPDDPVQPDSAIPPAAGVYSSIADLGAELDRIENKLHAVLDIGTDGAIVRTLPLVPDADPVQLEGDETVQLVDDSAGFIVTVTNIGNQTDERFGEPRMLHKLGRVVVGSATGWLSPIEITVTPMLICDLPPGVKYVRVHVASPAVATIQKLKKATPLG